jgi:pimeloyl-ACP methyl ester carboxylesterase
MNTDTVIRPFQIHIPDADVDDLRDRLDRTRWPAQPAGTGWSRGVPVDYLRDLAGYWAHEYDWRAHEARLNEIPQFVTTIDGQDIHFLHLRSGRPDALPLVLTHGWPSSPVEFLRVLGPLTDPDSPDAFDVVVPTLPGYGISPPVDEPGWGNLFRVAQAWAELMRRLGYERYGAQSTDAGAGVAALLAMVDGDRLVGSHLTGTTAAMPFGPPVDEEAVRPADRDRARRFNEFRDQGVGYLHLQATRPQTLAYALTDSPVAQLAWVVEKFREWTDPARELPEDAVDKDQLLTSVSLTWFNRAGASSAHATYEGMQAYREIAASMGDGGWDEGPEGPPVGYAVFAADTTIRSLVDPGGRVQHWSEFERGGHFPAMEVPDLLVDDVRAFFRPLR